MRSKIIKAQPSDSAPCLVFIRGGIPGKVVELKLSIPCVIGRSSDCHLRIDEPTVSGKHASIYKQRGKLYIQDLDSTNGTLVAGKKISEAALIAGGELVNFGEVLVKFLLHGSAEHDYHQKLYDSVYRDGLTQVRNRRFLDENINDILQLNEQTSSKLSFIMFDIDHFKKINDVYGHIVGDRILKQTCSLLERLLRKEDILIRYGGEEFIIVMPNTGPKYAEKIVNRILTVYRRFNFKKEGSGPEKVTLSAGISFIDYANTIYTETDATNFISAADKALYQAKRLGRNRAALAYK